MYLKGPLQSALEYNIFVSSELKQKLYVNIELQVFGILSRKVLWITGKVLCREKCFLKLFNIAL